MLTAAWVKGWGTAVAFLTCYWQDQHNHSNLTSIRLLKWEKKHPDQFFFILQHMVQETGKKKKKQLFWGDRLKVALHWSVRWESIEDGNLVQSKEVLKLFTVLCPSSQETLGMNLCLMNKISRVAKKKARSWNHLVTLSCFWFLIIFYIIRHARGCMPFWP